jgi:hypothetical protein
VADDVIDLLAEKAARRPAASVLTVIATDVGSRPGVGHFAWTWEVMDAADEWKPSNPQWAQQLRRIADRWDPPRARKVTRRVKLRRGRR